MCDTTQKVSELPVQCPLCGKYSAPDVTECPHCGQPLQIPEVLITRKLFRAPLTHPIDHPGQDYFPREANAILQFLPSGQVFSLKLNKPVILGREGEPNPPTEYIDLSELNAVRHGVSREHCQFRREAHQLIVTDLKSTNGTYINDRRLRPGENAVILHGDKLILGTLHLIVTFSTLEG